LDCVYLKRIECWKSCEIPVNLRRYNEVIRARSAKKNYVSHGTSGNWRWHAWRLLALWGLVLAAYSNSFQAGLVFDSANVIAGDPRIR
jgi:hypothetical protein